MQLQIDCLMAVVGFDHENLKREASVGTPFLLFSFTFVTPNCTVFLCISLVFTTNLLLIPELKSSSPHVFFFFFFFNYYYCFMF